MNMFLFFLLVQSYECQRFLYLSIARKIKLPFLNSISGFRSCFKTKSHIKVFHKGQPEKSHTVQFNYNNQSKGSSISLCTLLTRLCQNHLKNIYFIYLYCQPFQATQLVRLHVTSALQPVSLLLLHSLGSDNERAMHQSL